MRLLLSLFAALVFATTSAAQLPIATDFPLVPDDSPRAPVEVRALPQVTLPHVPDDQPKQRLTQKPLSSPELPFVADDQAKQKTATKPLVSPELPSIPDDKPKQRSVQKSPTSPKLPALPDDPILEGQYFFAGQWLPDVDSTKLGPDNFTTLQNMRPVDGGVQGILGCTEINTSAISGAPEIETGIHFKKDNPAETHVLIHADDGDIYDNTTAIPSQGNFTATALYSDASGAGDPRFSQAPNGHIAFANGVESTIWAGDEMPCGAFITSTADVIHTVTNPKDYSVVVNNDINNANNVATIGNGVDGNTRLLIRFDGTDGDSNNYTSEETWGHTCVQQGTAQLDTAQNKFGSASALLDGNSDYYSVSDDDVASNYWDISSFGTLEFTIDLWFRIPSTLASGNHGLIEQYDDSDNYYSFYLSSDGSTDSVNFVAREAAATTVSITGALSSRLVVDTWYHIAVIRGWGGDDEDWAITLNGTSVATGTDSTPLDNMSADLHVGRTQTAAPGYFGGWIDEVRISTDIARWYSNFSVPSAPYASANYDYFLIGSPIPLQGVKLYVGNKNTPISTMTAYTWSDGGWAELSITDNTAAGITLFQTGTVTWDSTVGLSDPKFIDGRFLYWYKINISAGSATIYKATLNAPWQEIVDMWDGVERIPIRFQVYDNSVYEDYVYEVNSTDKTYFGDLGGLLSTEWVVVMFQERATAVNIRMVAGKEQANAATATVYYHNGEDWESVGTISDLTLDSAGSTKSLAQSGVISWDAPPEEQEFSRTMFGAEGYVYKIVWSADLSADCDVNYITGVPAQRTVQPFKFTAQYLDRLLLCGFTEGGQGNRCDFSQSQTAQVFNGEESSGGVNSSPLYFGGNEDLNAGIQLHNRVGSNIYDFFIALKDSETYSMTGDGPDNFKISRISETVGCPSHATVASAEVGFDIEGAMKSQIIIWLSYSGPRYTDGIVVYPLKGIDSYFDPEHANYVSAASIESATGWCDQLYKEYNLRVGDYWFVYDLTRKKWYEKSTGTTNTIYANCGFPVRDTNGTQYIYTGGTAGIMYRMENGYDWAEDYDLNYVIETGDFWPTKSQWDFSVIDRFKYTGAVTDSAAEVDIEHYADGSSTATSVDEVANTGDNDFFRETTNTNLTGWSHRLKFTSTSSTNNIEVASTLVEDDCTDDDTGDWDVAGTAAATTFDTDHYEIECSGSAGHFYIGALSAVSGSHYRVSFKIKNGTASGAVIKGYHYDSVSSFYAGDYTTTGSFVEYSVIIRAAQTSAISRFGLQVEDLSGGNLEIKDFLVELLTAESYVNKAPLNSCTDSASDVDVTTGWSEVDTTLDSVVGGDTGFCLELTEAGVIYAYARKFIVPTAGGFYRFTGKVKAPGAEQSYRVLVYDHTNSAVLWDEDAEETAGDWSTDWDSGLIQIPDGCVSVSINVSLRPVVASGSTMLFDDVTFQQESSNDRRFKPLGWALEARDVRKDR